MKRFFALIIIMGLFVFTVACGRQAQEEAAPTGTPGLLSTVTPVPTKAMSPTPTVTPAPTATPTPTVTPTPLPTATPIPTETPIGYGKRIAIDPGHQAKGNYEKEPVGPGAAELKTKVSAGTTGRTTKVTEHEFNLSLSLCLKEKLTALGYEVVMTRETAQVNVSNAERAEIANNAEADIFIRIHADGSDNTAAHGISVLYPSENNPYVGMYGADSKRLAKAVLDGMCEETGAKNRGIIVRDDLSGTNWAKMPVILVEAGFMTNEAEEKKLVTPEYQASLAEGIVKGVGAYFEE